MTKDRYIYPAIFDYADDGISVEFPDLPGCLTCGDTDEEALRMAKEALALHLYSCEKHGDPIPDSSRTKEIQTEKERDQSIVMIEVWMPPFRDEMEQKSVRKTLTIPRWLDDLASESKVNYSHILQDGLKRYLGVKKKDKKA